MDIGRQKNKDAADINVGDKSISCDHENDTISRQAAINKILGQPPEPHYPSWYAEQIKELPSAQPEPLKIDLSGYSKEDWERFRKEWANVPIMALPKRGRWERHYSRPNVYADLFWHCSECGYRSSDNWADKFNFCPNCGADMRGGQE